MAWLLNNLAEQKKQRKKADIYRSVMQMEARLGGELFGPTPKGVRREFFCLDPTTWVWHEEWDDTAGHHAVTTRYDVRPNGIVKSQGANSYQSLSAEEERRFHQAAKMYHQKVGGELRRLMAQTKV
jgi:hypothetical protein